MKRPKPRPYVTVGVAQYRPLPAQRALAPTKDQHIAAVHRQWWRLDINAIFSSRTIYNQRTQLSRIVIQNYLLWGMFGYHRLHANAAFSLASLGNICLSRCVERSRVISPLTPTDRHDIISCALCPPSSSIRTITLWCIQHWLFNRYPRCMCCIPI